MHNLKFTLALLLAFPCTIGANDSETIKYLCEEYNKCMTKAKSDYWHLSDKNDLANEKKRCELILRLGNSDSEPNHVVEERIAKVEKKNNWLEKSNDLQQKEIENLKTRIKCLEALQRNNNHPW